MKTSESGRTTVRRTITVARPARDIYAFWRDPARLAVLLRDMVQVSPTQQGTHWKMDGVLGTSTEWDAVLTGDDPGRGLEWRSVGGDEDHRSLRIDLLPAPGEQGTEIALTFEFQPPGGVLGDALAKLFAVPPNTMAGKALHRFKALAETGEIPTLRYNTSTREEAIGQGEQK